MGLVIELRPEMEARYRALHADPWEAVLRRITGSNIRDYSIYLARVHGRLLLFSHFRYVGEDFERDMSRIADDEEDAALVAGDRALSDDPAGDAGWGAMAHGGRGLPPRVRAAASASGRDSLPGSGHFWGEITPRPCR